MKTLDIPAPALPVNPYAKGEIYRDYTLDGSGAAALRQQNELENGEKVRPPIGHDTPIEGGAYDGLYGGESIIVDREVYPDGFWSVMDKVIKEVGLPNGRIDKGLVLDSIYDNVTQAMHYDSDAVKKILESHGGKDGTKIPLDEYIQKGVGVCRHQALFVGQLLEYFCSRGLLAGKVSVERSAMKSKTSGKYDGHAWIRYTNGAGMVYIIDVAQQKIGLLEEFMKMRMDGNEDIWEYGRESDYDKLIGEALLDTVTVTDSWLSGASDASAGESEGKHPDGDNSHIVDGVIVRLPDWMDPHREEEAEKRIEKSSAEITLDMFRSFRDNFIHDVDHAIKNAGHIDPHMMAGQFSYKINELIRTAPSLSQEMIIYLNKVVEVCATVQRAGRDSRSEYYGYKVRGGLQKIRDMIDAIQV